MEQYVVRIAGLQAYGYNGVSEEERTVGHRLLVDLEFTVNGAATHTDHISDTIDYARATASTLDFLARHPQQTLERLAAILAEFLLREFTHAVTVQVSLQKPHPPIAAILESAGVVVKKSR